MERNQFNDGAVSPRRIAQRPPVWPVALVIALLAMPPVAQAFEVATGNDELKIRWDNTVKYSTGMRLKEPSSKLTADANQDDGNRNFDKGSLISNRFDLLSEFDLTYRNMGFRVSGAAWYDDVYNRDNDHDSPFTVNSASVVNNKFTKATRDLHGRKAELLDYFVFGKAEVGDSLVNLRLGSHTLLYGESLFFGGNGIAAAQAPIDFVKLLSVPNTQFKELMRPIPQVSAQIQLNSTLSVGGYYQFSWDADRLPAAGSYFSGGRTSWIGAASGSFSGRDFSSLVLTMSRPAIRGREAFNSVSALPARMWSTACMPPTSMQKALWCSWTFRVASMGWSIRKTSGRSAPA